MALKIIAAVSVAALAGGVFLTDRQAAARVTEAEKAFPPEGQMINVNGRQVHAVVRGEGPVVILLHGAGGNTREWSFSIMDRLADRYRVIAFDRPGMGYTDRADAKYEGAFTAEAESPAEQAEMLFAAAHMLNVEQAILVGHSYGSIVALAWALNHPEMAAGVVTLGGVSHPWPGDLGAYYTVNGSSLGGAMIPPMIAAYASDERIEAAVAGIFTPQPVPEGYTDYIGAPLTIRPDSFRANTRQVNTLYPHVVEMAPRYATELTMPLEIIHGDLDKTVPLDVHSIPLEAAVPQANLTVLEGVGHMPHHAAPDVLEAAIDRIAAQLP